MYQHSAVQYNSFAWGEVFGHSSFACRIRRRELAKVGSFRPREANCGAEHILGYVEKFFYSQ